MARFSLSLDGAPVDSLLVDLGAAASAAAKAMYQDRIVSEARAIVAGELAVSPTDEHLRVLLDRLDGLQPRPSALDEKPF